MSVKFYIASKLENAEQVKRVSEKLKAIGWKQTYDWTVHGSVQGSHARLEEVSKAETRGVMQADIVIVLLPGGRGTHAELGIAVACTGYGKIYLCSSDGKEFTTGEETCAFYWLPEMRRLVGSEGHWIEQIMRENGVYL